MSDKDFISMTPRGLTALGLAATLTLSACGGGGGGSGSRDGTPPTASLDQTGPVLDKTARIVVTFSEPMDTDSLQLGGALEASSTLAWSDDGKTLTLTPGDGTWPRGSGVDLSIDAKDRAGNALPTVTAAWLVKLEFNTFQPAATVIGQADFTGTGPNKGTGAETDYDKPAADSLATPYGNPAVSSSGTLFISDTDNYRVLGYHTFPTVNTAAADFVLGQPDFTSNEPGGLPRPEGVSIAGGKMAVADSDGNRVLIYNTVPTSGGAEPDVVVGQTSLDSEDTACDATHLRYPEAAVLTPDGKLVVADSSHNRVLIWNALPTTHGQPADLVLGQPDFTRCAPDEGSQDGSVVHSARALDFPTGLWTDGHRLALADNDNNRVLIWNTFPTSHFQPADIVLGQADFTSVTGSAENLDTPYGIDSNGEQLAVTDSRNHRVLIWNSFPTNNFQQADIVLGQSDLTHNQSNDDDQNGEDDGAASARVLNFPTGVYFYRDKLMVPEAGNHRVLIFQSL
ncbi:NHL repeat protein [Alloalcanivorax dieselolei B5]|uniref:NHL repeat protein n=1 Tax=Alcanivorax dieselolei (strain DSM 16502 / CGMCC 1.3690 / MCCC 1A00001 / B-5) TaxID=930169 RepID=K0C556_ALCDB|nr:NHL repeat protein [Alloalcanivorax dieselolei]AFT68549.1 NHL repeat protein [Alloalcanivorax dieselolei B5]GGJ98759.1 hypothetical protein GCM10007426_29890 [Alloalcanivorax dieselolei]